MSRLSRSVRASIQSRVVEAFACFLCAVSPDLHGFVGLVRGPPHPACVVMERKLFPIIFPLDLGSYITNPDHRHNRDSSVPPVVVVPPRRSSLTGITEVVFLGTLTPPPPSPGAAPVAPEPMGAPRRLPVVFLPAVPVRPVGR